MDELGTQVAVLTERVDALQQVVIDEKRRLNGNLERIDKRLAEMSVKLDAARETAVASVAAAAAAASAKPSWGTLAAITGLSSAVVGLATYLLTH